jgi:uncharacterized repeat protein (TIGR01451 family)
MPGLPPGAYAPGSPALPPVVPGVPGEPPVPVVAIRVQVAAETQAGQDIEYRLHVVNQSRAAAHHVTVRNPVPNNARFVRAEPAPGVTEPELVWRLGTLQAGQAREIVLALRPTGGDVSSCARVSFEHGQCVTTRIARPALSVRKSAPAQVVLYDPVTFRIEVVNTGPAPLGDVVVTDILPRELRYETSTPAPDRRELLTWTLGTLAPGERKVIEYRAITLQEGTFSNRAVVTGAGGLREEAVSRVTVGRARLSLSMVGPDRRYANLPAVYELTVSNPGTAPASNVTVSNPLPANTRFLNASDGGMLVEGEVRWSLGTLAAGAKRTVKLQLAAQAAGEATNRATARADRELSAQAEARTVFQGVAGLSAQLRDRDPLEVGQEGEYELVVRNTGTGDATELKVTATVPAQLQVTDTQGPGKATAQEGRVSYEAVTLKAGEEVRYRIYARALKAGDVRFRVDVEAKELTAGPLREEESTTIFEDVPSGGGP